MDLMSSPFTKGMMLWPMMVSPPSSRMSSCSKWEGALPNGGVLA